MSVARWKWTKEQSDKTAAHQPSVLSYIGGPSRSARLGHGNVAEFEGVADCRLLPRYFASQAIANGVRILELLFDALLLSVPIFLAFLVPSRAGAIVLGTLWVWLVLVVSTQYLLAMDPDYDSFAPGIALFAGWVLGFMVSSICVLLAIVTQWVYGWLVARADKDDSQP